MRRNQEAAVTISLVVAVLCLTTVASRVAFVIIGSLPREKREILGPNFRILEIVNSSSNLFIYLWRSTEFRRNFLKIFCKFCPKFRVAPNDQQLQQNGISTFRSSSAAPANSTAFTWRQQSSAC
jgi:hypothetical protein